MRKKKIISALALECEKMERYDWKAKNEILKMCSCVTGPAVLDAEVLAFHYQEKASVQQWWLYLNNGNKVRKKLGEEEGDEKVRGQIWSFHKGEVTVLLSAKG